MKPIINFMSKLKSAKQRSITIEKFVLGTEGTNTYVLTKISEKRAVIIDAGENPHTVLEKLKDFEVEAVLITHTHIDHIAGLEEIIKTKQCPVYIHSLANNVGPFEKELKDGQKLTLLGETCIVLHTPGHSPESVSFYYPRQKKLFCGDVLFRQSVGRTDIPGGDTEQLVDSLLTKIFNLSDSVEVHPGHGETTTIGFEKKNNPIFQ